MNIKLWKNQNLQRWEGKKKNLPLSLKKTSIESQLEKFNRKQSVESVVQGICLPRCKCQENLRIFS